MGTSWAGWALAALVLLAGCAGGAERAAPGAAPATQAPTDWRNASYTITCDGIVPSGFRASLVDGAARVPADGRKPPYYDHYDVRVEADASGDIDGDGVPDTVVLLQCSPQPSNGIVEEALVFSGAGGRLGVLPSPRTLREGTVLAPLYDPAGLSVQHGDVVAAMRVYAPDDSHAGGPSERTTVRWHWNGHAFVRLP